MPCSNHNLWKTHQKSIISLAGVLSIIMAILGHYTEHKSESISSVINIFSHHNKAKHKRTYALNIPTSHSSFPRLFFLLHFSAINYRKSFIKKVMYVANLLGSIPVYNLWKFRGIRNWKYCINMHKTNLFPKQYASEIPTQL